MTKIIRGVRHTVAQWHDEEKEKVKSITYIGEKEKIMETWAFCTRSFDALAEATTERKRQTKYKASFYIYCGSTQSEVIIHLCRANEVLMKAFCLSTTSLFGTVLIIYIHIYILVSLVDPLLYCHVYIIYITVKPIFFLMYFSIVWSGIV